MLKIDYQRELHNFKIVIVSNLVKLSLTTYTLNSKIIVILIKLSNVELALALSFCS